jgi:N-acetylmuramoyl-L-alanine amidase
VSGNGRVRFRLAAAGLLAVAAVLAMAASASDVARAGQAAAPATRHVAKAAARKPLTGKIIGIDPGHNGRNWTDPSFLTHQIWNGREWMGCDTTGTRDLAGLNLTTMPKVPIECGNMNNSADSRLLTSVRVQRDIAWALAQAIIRFLHGR